MFQQTARASMALTLAAGLALAQTGTAPGTPSGTPRTTPEVRFDNSPRVHELIRAGNLYLSLGDALSLAIENNLDIELQRYLLPIGNTELLRAQGGGLGGFIAPSGIGVALCGHAGDFVSAGSKDFSSRRRRSGGVGGLPLGAPAGQRSAAGFPFGAAASGRVV